MANKIQKLINQSNLINKNSRILGKFNLILLRLIMEKCEQNIKENKEKIEENKKKMLGEKEVREKEILKHNLEITQQKLKNFEETAKKQEEDRKLAAENEVKDLEKLKQMNQNLEILIKYNFIAPYDTYNTESLGKLLRENYYTYEYKRRRINKRIRKKTY